MNQLVKLERNSDFYRLLLAITFPIALQNIISNGVGLINSLMLGQLGSTQIAAVSLGNQPNFIFMLLTTGLASGATVLTAQYWGKNEMTAIRHVVAIVLRFAFFASLVFAFLVGVFPEPVMRLFSSEQDVIAEGVRYLRISAFSYPFFGLTNTILYILRSVEKVWMSFWVTIVTFITTIALNWLLIFGKLGFPPLGVVGAAWANVSARVLAFLLVLYYLLVREKQISFRIKDIFLQDALLTADFLRHCSPVILNEFLWGLGSAAQNMILGHLGKEGVTAYSIASAVQQMAMVFMYGMVSASSVIFGKALGANQTEKIQPYLNTMKLLSLLLGLLAAGSILLFKNPIIAFYQIDASTKLLTNQFMLIVAIVALLQCIYSPISLGALRAGGDTRFVLLTDVSFMWVLGLPLGILAAQVWHLPVVWVYVLLKIDEPVKLLLIYRRSNGTKWIRNLTREINDTVR
ncbi:MAG: MATE family efflux transporter [Negativicutes bacterium]|nr:MATE family efflux transporter [Negativicutes bacterium]